MLKGILIGVVISATLLLAAYNSIGFGAGSCGPGVGFIIVPFALLICSITATAFIKNKSLIVSVAAKTVVIITMLSLLLYFILIFG